MDRQIGWLIDQERIRQQHELEMIASENYVSPAVMQSCGNVFTNKYSEGYPGRRYYGGQKRVDRLERTCQWRALKMFGLLSDDQPDSTTQDGYQQIKQQLKAADRAVNVQPLSGSPANLAVYLGVLSPGDTILGMDLAAGGHLSHGHPLNASGVYYQIQAYGVDKQTHLLDYEQILHQALTHKPQLILAGFSAYSRGIDRSQFDEIADQVEKKHGYRPLLMADIAHIAGLVAGGVLSSPFPYFDIVTTTTHKTLRGPRGALIYTRRGSYQRNNQEIDLTKSVNRGVFPGLQGGPHQHLIASKAVAFQEIIDTQLCEERRGESFDIYTKRIVANAQALAESLIELGWNVETGGTDNHLLLVDVTQRKGNSLDMTGKVAEKLLEKIGISTNKNMLPFDPRSPLDPSGIRLGTPAVTTRKMEEEQMYQIAECIDTVLSSLGDEDHIQDCQQRIGELCDSYPLPYQK